MTQISTINTIIVIGILAAIALPAYQDYIAKSQATEAFTLADGLKTTIATNRERNSCVSTDTNANKIAGKYGTAKIDDTATAPNCTITYTFNDDNVSDRVKSKVITMTVDPDSSKLVKSAGDLEDKYIPTAIKQ